MPLLKTFVNSVEKPIISVIPSKEAERAMDTARFRFPASVFISQNDTIQVVVDCIDLTGMKAIHHFENTGKDESGYARDLTATGITYAAAKFGHGAVFNGTTGAYYLRSNYDFPTDIVDMTIQVKTTQTGANKYIVNYAYESPPVSGNFKSGDGNFLGTDGNFLTDTSSLIIDAFSIAMTEGEVYVMVNGVNTGLSGVVINDGQWHQVRVYWAKSDGRVFIWHNGTLAFTSGVTSTTDLVSSRNLVLGQKQTTLGGGFDVANSFNGTIDLFRFYARQLTDTEYAAISSLKNHTSTMKFGGKVWQINDQVQPREIDCKSFGKIIGEVEIKAATFTNQTVDAIIQSLITNPDNTTLNYIDRSTPTSMVLSKHVADGKLIDILADLVPIIGKTFRTDGLGNFFLEDYTQRVSDITYEHGEKAILNASGSVDTELVNDITLIGQNFRYSTEVTFSGNGSNKVFTLQDSPLRTKVKVSGTLKRAEVDYTVDIEAKTITMEVAPPNAANNVVIDYEYEAPILVRGRRNSSVTKYGRRDRRIVAPWIKTYADGVKYVQTYLNTYKDVRARVTVTLPYISIEADESLLVTLKNEIKAIDATFTIKSISYEYPAGRTQIICGEFDFDAFEAHKQIVDKLHDLESVVVTTKGIRDFESVEEELSLQFVLFKQLGSSSGVAETLSFTEAVNSFFADSGWDSGKYDYNAVWE